MNFKAIYTGIHYQTVLFETREADLFPELGEIMSH